MIVPVNILRSSTNFSLPRRTYCTPFFAVDIAVTLCSIALQRNSSKVRSSSYSVSAIDAVDPLLGRTGLRAATKRNPDSDPFGFSFSIIFGALSLPLPAGSILLPAARRRRFVHPSNYPSSVLHTSRSFPPIFRRRCSQVPGAATKRLAIGFSLPPKPLIRASPR